MKSEFVSGVLVLAIAGCRSPARSDVPASDAAPPVDVLEDAQQTDASLPDAFAPLRVDSITPTLGSVAGGTVITLRGDGFTPATHVRIAGVDCTATTVLSHDTLACITGSNAFHEGSFDVIATDGSQQAVLANAFTYQCPWTTTTGRRSCGAVPPATPPTQQVATWITQFEAGHGFTANADGAGATSLGDTSDFALGAQSVFLETDGAGTLRTLQKVGCAPIDFTDRDLKVWVKVANVAHLSTLDVAVGDSSLGNQFRFRLRSSQGQQWMTDGDWVSFAIPWSASNYTVIGTPNRAAITDILVRVGDDATGNHVRVHLNGLAVVAEPTTTFPAGVISYTFDDNYASMVDPGATTLAQHGFAATSYVIVDMVDKAGRATLANLHDLATAGWDISVHANTDADHAARYPALTSTQVEDDMVDARAWLISNGFRGYDQCAYPGGDFSGGPDVLSLAGRYFQSCRTIYQRQQETFAPSDARKLRVLYVTNGVSLASVEQAVDNARASRAWLILVFHELVTTPTTSTQWSATDFAALADYVAASGVPVKTVSDVLR